ncbi:MAG: oxygen-independent coproporphyrinogen III oxidase [Alphaproteobacteria bacterium]|nr:oxygen-independent coproporphyrinogen III oxidase [Alphaproteobacteria bacterium]MDE1931767.1 oxygen-independent coproporphyrinogen III oxidase [Alphaproteobacteria bacterium]
MAALSPLLQGTAAERLPRYTSYPTAPNFTPAIDNVVARDWLRALDPSATASLYFHVPYCRALCWYCGCHTKIPSDDAAISHYVDALLAEIDLVAALLPARLGVTHLHWGGGTPTIIGPSAMHRLYEAIFRNFLIEAGAEIAIEIDPRMLTSEMAMALGTCGFTRASLGVQTFDPVVQHAIHRIQSADATEAAVRRLRSAGIRAINFDLIYGLPHQTVASCVKTAERVLALAPDRVAVFGYAHVPAVKANQRHIDQTALPDAAMRFAQAEAIAETFVAAGYRRIGLDHFAKSDDPLTHALDAGTLHRNFQGYTIDRADALLGFGASAIGRLPQGYVQNTPRIAAYREAAAAGRLAVARGYALTAEDRLRAAVIERLMCDLTVDLQAVAAMHLPSFDFTRERAHLAELASDGLLEIDGARVTVRAAMRPFVRRIAAVFDIARNAGTTHAPAV